MMTVDQKTFEHLKNLENKLNAVRSEFCNLVEFSGSRADKYINNMIALLKFLKKLSNDIYELEIEKSLTISITGNSENADAFIHIFYKKEKTALESWKEVKKIIDKLLNKEN